MIADCARENLKEAVIYESKQNFSNRIQGGNKDKEKDNDAITVTESGMTSTSSKFMTV